jgi:neurotransmitter:Na+ symporter, NSS family
MVDDYQRDRWDSRLIFLFAAIGSAVGLGNIWRFPYLAYEYGGGAFLIPYLLALFVIGIPLLMMEFALGQKFQRGAMQSLGKINKRLEGVGLMAILSGFVVVVYYAAVMAWSVLYLSNSFSSSLPWADDAKGFFFGNILNISDGIGQLGGINIPILVALLMVWITIFLCVRNGVKSVGKVVAITMPLPLILLVVLFFRAITLEGALLGIMAYITPNFSALLDTEIWLAAASQIFFTLSLGFGIMIAYGSYNKEESNVVSNSLWTAFANSAISLFAGFVVFGILGYMAQTTGVAVQDVVASGPGLAFVVFPQALSLMPYAAVFSVFFFLMILSLGIDSAFSLVEAVNAVIHDKWKNVSKQKIAAITCSVAFLFGILFTTRAGLYYLDVFDHFVTNFGLVIVGILQCIAVGWIYGADKLREFINKHSHIKLGKWWSHAIKYVIPIILTILVVVQFYKELQGPYEGYPMWAIGLGSLGVIIPGAIALWMARK